MGRRERDKESDLQKEHNETVFSKLVAVLVDLSAHADTRNLLSLSTTEPRSGEYRHWGGGGVGVCINPGAFSVSFPH